MQLTLKKYYNINKVKESWNKLYKSNPDLTIFQDYNYAENIYKKTKIRGLRYNIFFEISHNGQPLLIAPMTKKIIPSKTKNWRIFGVIQGCDTTDFIYSADMTTETMEECLKLLHKQMKGAKTYKRLRENSVLSTTLRRMHPEKELPPYPHVCIPAWDDADQYTASLSKSTRQNIRTAHNRLQKDGLSWSLQTATPISSAPTLWEEAMSIYIDRQIEAFDVRKRHSRKNTIKYYLDKKHDSISLKKLPNTYISLLKINNKPAATLMGFIDTTKKSLVVPRLAMNAEHNRYSPGLILIVETLREMIAQTNIRSIDLSRGDERYKYVMGGKEYHTNEFQIPR